MLLTDLSKAFDCIDYKRQIAKIYGYEVSPSALIIISFYVKHRTKRNEINYFFTARLNIGYGVSQDSLFGRLLFNINP